VSFVLTSLEAGLPREPEKDDSIEGVTLSDSPTDMLSSDILGPAGDTETWTLAAKGSGLTVTSPGFSTEAEEAKDVKP